MKMLVVAVMIAPFTELRFSFVGMSEIIILLILIISLSKNNVGINHLYFTRFWFFFLITLMLSSVINILFFDNYDVLYGWYDFFSYLLVFFTVYLFEKKIKKRQINPYFFIKKIFYWMSTLLILLYVFSFFSRSFFGLLLFYHERFAPLVNNPHKIAIFSSVLPFFGLLVFKNEEISIGKKMVVIVIILLDVLITLESDTSKSMLGLFLGFGIFFAFNYLPKQIIKLVIALGLFVLVILFIKYNVNDYLINSFNELDYKGGRSLIYSSGIRQFLSSPFIGYGFGSAIIIGGVKTDAHQTMITVLLQGGVFALFIFLNLLFCVIKKLKNNGLVLISAFIPIFLYIVGGDIMRNNYVWILIMLMYYYPLSYKKE